LPSNPYKGLGIYIGGSMALKQIQQQKSRRKPDLDEELVGRSVEIVVVIPNQGSQIIRGRVINFSTYFLKIDSGNATYYVNKPFIAYIKA
jgi:RNase P/RNase MRP subunit p29